MNLPRYNIWIGFKTIVKRELLRILRIWPQTLFPSIITSVLYFMIFGKVIGSRVGQINGVDYISFILPGLIMLAAILNSYNNVVSSFFGAKFQKNIEEILVSPLSSTAIIIGFVVGGVFRGLITACSVVGVALFFHQIPFYNITIVIVILLLTTIFFSLCGLLNAIFARKFDDITIFPTFILSPLIYLGGVFYSVELLPSFWKSISLLNPILYMVNAFRYGLLGVTDIPIAIAFLFLGVAVCFVFFLCLFLFKKGFAGPQH